MLVVGLMNHAGSAIWYRGNTDLGSSAFKTNKGDLMTIGRPTGIIHVIEEFSWLSANRGDPVRGVIVNEHDPGAIRREARPAVVRARGENALAAAFELLEPDTKGAVAPRNEGYGTAVGRDAWYEIIA